MDIRRPLFIIVLLWAVCCSVQATTVFISVIDESDNAFLEGASVSVNGEYVGRTDSYGELTYEHSETESLNLKITKSGYEDWNDIVSESDTSILAELSRKSEFLTVVLYDADTITPVEGALVKVSGEGLSDAERSDADGKSTFELMTGATCTVEVRASRYDTLLKTVEIADGAKEVQYWLYRNDQFVVKVSDAVVGDPVEGATVSIDERVEGTTDATGMLVLYLERERSYTFNVEKSTYRTVQERRYIGVDEAVYEVNLGKSLYPVSISVFNDAVVPVDGAKVYIDGDLLGTTDSYGRCGTSSLIAGSHTVEVRRDGYLDWQQTLSLAGSGEDIVVNLAYAAAHLVIIVEDVDHRILPGAVVLVDGEEIGTTDANGQITADLATASVYNLTALAEGYATAGVDTELPLGTSEDAIAITLEKTFDPWIFGVAGIGIGGVLLIGYGMRKLTRKRKGGSRRTRKL
jgi:hypothetical protein